MIRLKSFNSKKRETLKSKKSYLTKIKNLIFQGSNLGSKFVNLICSVEILICKRKILELRIQNL